MSLLVPCPGCGITRKADDGHHLCRQCEGYEPMTDAEQRRRRMPEPRCESVHGCGEPAVTSGLCAEHLRQSRAVWEVNASSHLEVLDHFCRTDPALVRERLAAAGGDPDA